MVVGAILVQNTAWANVETALANLRAKKLLDARRLLKADPKELQEAIRPAGSYNQKADYLRTFSRFVATHPGGLDALFKKPAHELRPLLLSFKGFGEETADAVIVFAAGQASFVVDAYTRRLTKRLGLGTGEEKYEVLQKVWGARLLPTARAFGEAHALLVEHAKAICTAKLPRCPACPLASVCPQVGVDPEVFRRG